MQTAARGLATVFYSMLVAEMQRSIPLEAEDSGAVGQGVRDLFQLYMPRALAEQDGDALTLYIRENLEPVQPALGAPVQRAPGAPMQGDLLDERI